MKSSFVDVSAIGYSNVIDARFSHVYFCQSLYTMQRGLPAIVALLVHLNVVLHIRFVFLSCRR